MTQSHLVGRYFPWAVVTLAAVGVLFVARPPSEAPDLPHIQAFGNLPVVEGGRVKPMDTVARNTMMVIGTRQSYPNPDGKGPSQPAIRWMLDSLVGGELFDGQPAHKSRVFRIDNDEVLGLLGLEQRPGSFRYSLEDIGPKVDKLVEVATRARKKDPKERALVDVKALELAENLQRAIQIARLETPLVIPPPTPDGDDWRTLPDALRAWPAFMNALKAEESREDKAASGTLLGRVLGEAAKAPGSAAPGQAAVLAYGQMLDAYARGDAPTFNRLVDDYGQKVAQERPRDVKQARFEAFFNRFEPFVLCLIFYLVALVMTFVSWLVWSEPLRRAAFWLIVLTLALHTWALVARIMISGRPPVTNLYSSAVFIGWACVILGLILELLYGMSIGNLVAAVGGSLTVLIAHNLAGTGSGDTMGVMEAVLDTNFWLATHVVIVTLGYAATFVAGLLGIVLIVMGILTSKLDRTLYRALGQAIYGVVCLAAFLSFVGTVLGGIWADQSWGRFWGWDPKENGALLIVLMNALILHARWGGLVQQRGMAVLAVLGNIVTAWSWFGVNMLGVGLHSYGFMEGAAFWLGAFIVSQLLLAGVGAVLPLPRWRSYAALRSDAPPAPQPPRARPRRGAPSTAITTR